MGNRVSAETISRNRQSTKSSDSVTQVSVSTSNSRLSSTTRKLLFKKKKSKVHDQLQRVEKPRLGKKYVVETLREGKERPAILTALQWVDAKNKHDMMRLYQVTNHDAVFHFPDMDVHLPMRPFWDSMMTLFDAVPDLSFSFTSVEEVRPGVVVIQDYIGAGHHTGNPLEFPPNPPVPPTGVHIADEPIQVTITVKHNKITDLVADTLGDGIAGPPGFYSKAKAAYELAKLQ